MENQYCAITSKKVGKVYVATTEIVKSHTSLKFEVNMSGITKQIAEEKLRLFLENKPYKHLDNL